MTVSYIEPVQLATLLRTPEDRTKTLVIDVRDEARFPLACPGSCKHGVPRVMH